MGHQARHVARRVADAGDVVQRAVGIGGVRHLAPGVAILPQNLVARLQRRQRGFIREIAAFPVRDGHPQVFPRRDLVGKRRIRRDGFEVNEFAMKLQIAVADERPRQQPRLGEHLKPVAHAQHQPALAGKLLDRLHHRAEPRDRAAAQIIAIAETAGHDHRVGIAQRSVFVPDQPRGMAEQAHGVDGILIAVAGGKLENGKIHTK